MENVAADNSDPPADIPLLSGKTRSHWLTLRYRTTRKCVSSRAALLVLLWCCVVGLLSGALLNPDLSVAVVANADISWALYSFVALWTAYCIVALFTCFHPLAGFLADTKCGRYKTVAICTLLVAVSLLCLWHPYCLSN